MSGFDDAWEDSMKGQAVKEAELVNLSFTIYSVEWREGVKDGKPWASYIASIALDGQDETVEAWLGGKGVIAQLNWLVSNGKFPVHVKQTLENKAYKLVLLDGIVSVTSVAPPSGQWGCRDCRKVNPSENVKCWGCGRVRGSSSEPEPEPEEVPFE